MVSTAGAQFAAVTVILNGAEPGAPCVSVAVIVTLLYTPACVQPTAHEKYPVDGETDDPDGRFDPDHGNRSPSGSDPLRPTTSICCSATVRSDVCVMVGGRFVLLTVILNEDVSCPPAATFAMPTLR